MLRSVLNIGGGARTMHLIEAHGGIYLVLSGSDKRDIVTSSAVPAPNECPVTFRS